MKVPIILLTLNRPIQLKDMIDSIEAYTKPETYDIIICDNGSEQPEMLSLLETLAQKYTVIRNNQNEGFCGFNAGLRLVKTDRFILSDPDIRLSSKIPTDWVETFSKILDKSNSPKVGIALNINFATALERAKVFRARELAYWEKKAPYTDAQCYYAPVDTTLAMYRRDTFKHWEEGQLIFDDRCIHPAGHIVQAYNSKYCEETIRIAGDYTAEHMGWYVEEKYMPDWDDYSKAAKIFLSSTVYLAKHLIISGLDATKTAW